jgi:hypothetical protein
LKSPPSRRLIDQLAPRLFPDCDLSNHPTSCDTNQFEAPHDFVAILRQANCPAGPFSVRCFGMKKVALCPCRERVEFSAKSTSKPHAPQGHLQDDCHARRS